MNVDCEAKRVVIDFLRQNYQLSCWDSDEENQFSKFDLSCEWNGQRVGIEVKGRKQPSTTSYLSADNSCQEDKVYGIRSQWSDDVFDRILLISVYSDGVIRISDMMDSFTISEKLCPWHTDFDRNQKIVKRLAVFRKYEQYRI